MTCYRPLLRLCRKKFGLDSRPDQKDKADDGKNNSPRTMSMQSIEPFTEPNTSALPRNHGLVNNTRDNQEEEKYSEPYLLPSSLEQNVICGDIHKFVRQPTFVCRNEWIAGHVFEFFHLVNAFYESISDQCTSKSCGPLKLTDKWHYPMTWSPEIILALIEGSSLETIMQREGPLNAPSFNHQPSSMFIDYALTWIDQQLEDPQKFPSRIEGHLRDNFEQEIARPIFNLLYLVLGHVYRYHFGTVSAMEQVPHLNALMKHFAAFTAEFNLIHPSDRQAMAPLLDLLTLR